MILVYNKRNIEINNNKNMRFIMNNKERRYDPVTGKPVDKSYLEQGLPYYLQADLDAYKVEDQYNTLKMEPLWYNLYASINEALNDEEISDEAARYLRDKYLFKPAGT